MQTLKGTGVALVTPMLENGTLDLGSLEKLIDYVLEGGVEYIVALGTTGESPVLNWDEKMTYLAHTVQYVNRRVPIVLGLGGNNTTEILEKLPHLRNEKIDAILSVSPYYNKPSQEGLLRHYQVIAQESPYPVVLYNVPGRTASNVEAETVLKLAAHENIVGVKDASPDFRQLATIASEKPDDFLLLSGEDSLALPTMAIGGEGAISVIANFLPEEFSKMIRFAMNGDYSGARSLHQLMLKSYELLTQEGNPTSVKTALNVLGLVQKYVRLPLIQGSEDLGRHLRMELEGIKKGTVS